MTDPKSRNDCIKEIDLLRVRTIFKKALTVALITFEFLELGSPQRYPTVRLLHRKYRAGDRAWTSWRWRSKQDDPAVQVSECAHARENYLEILCPNIGRACAYAPTSNYAQGLVCHIALEFFFELILILLNNSTAGNLQMFFWLHKGRSNSET